MKNWIFLTVAIAAEVVGTTALKASEGFTRAGPSLLVAASYIVAFYFLSLTLRAIPVGVAYAVWSGLGIALITLIAWIVFDQKLDLPALLGMGCIVVGVVIMNVFSKALPH